jgi:RHH-type proline utilization regulon transcriptional repressor/proline dehydrogenase/delta 1-pyrroline-5-carboxylate dehydrogenase
VRRLARGVARGHRSRPRRSHPPPLGGAVWWGDGEAASAYEAALAARPGAILPLILGRPALEQVLHERHVCIDTTAAGGNASLLAGTGSATGSGV